MNKKTILLLILSFMFLLIAFFAVSKITGISSSFSKKLVVTDTQTITAQFLEDETKANNLFAGKIVEVEGIVKKISFLNNQKTVFLQTPYSDVFIICEMNSKHKELENILPNQTLKVKGTCKGFLKDVILLNCNIIANE